MIYFCSDTHFGHANVLRYDRRPFATIEEHDEALVENWNATVKPNDVVYHLGDVAWGQSAEEIDILLGRLHGVKSLITGNHDGPRVTKSPRWSMVSTYHEAKRNGQLICLFHYRMTVWNRSHHGSWALHGHSHGTLPEIFTAKTLDVGIMCWNYRPVSFEQIEAAMDQRTWVPVDGHTGLRA